MSELTLDVSVVLESDDKKAILKLLQQHRIIKKEIKRLRNVDKDGAKIEEWQVIHTLKQEVIERLKAQNISWKKFIATPDYFEYAWYISSGTSGAPKRIKTSMTIPSATETKTDEATMIKNAIDYRSKMVRRKKRKKTTRTPAKASSGKAEAQKTAGII